jgi:hypothetical protein
MISTGVPSVPDNQLPPEQRGVVVAAKVVLRRRRPRPHLAPSRCAACRQLTRPSGAASSAASPPLGMPAWDARLGTGGHQDAEALQYRRMRDKCPQKHTWAMNNAFLRLKTSSVGMRGCGKTANGKAAAKALGRTFVDSNDGFEEEVGTTINEFVDRHDWPAMRAKEADILGLVVSKHTTRLQCDRPPALREPQCVLSHLLLKERINLPRSISSNTHCGTEGGSSAIQRACLNEKCATIRRKFSAKQRVPSDSKCSSGSRRSSCIITMLSPRGGGSATSCSSPSASIATASSPLPLFGMIATGMSAQLEHSSA